MIAPALVAMVRVLLLVLRGRKTDMYWMVADLAKGLPSRRRAFGNRIGNRSIPKGRELDVEAQSIRQAPDHYSRLQ